MKRARQDTLDAEGAVVTHDAGGLKLAFAVSRFNQTVTHKLLAGARACLAAHGGETAEATVVHVPGAWELPLAAKQLAESGRHDAVIALGALIRGETAHFDVLAHAVANGLGRVGLDSGLPVIFGVLTTDTLDQALARAGDGPDNKGWEAVLAAIEMVGLGRKLR